MCEKHRGGATEAEGIRQERVAILLKLSDESKILRKHKENSNPKMDQDSDVQCRCYASPTPCATLSPPAAPKAYDIQS